MRKNITFLAVFLVISQCSALEVSIDCKEEFGPGEPVFFNYTFLSDSDVNITFVPYVECPEMPNALLYEDEAELKTGVPYTGSYFYGNVGAFPSQECEASVYVLETEQMKIKTLKIATDPVFDFRLMACADPSCEDEMPVFVKGETIYIDFESDAEGVETECVMVRPDGSEEVFPLPYSFAAEESGVYGSEANASKNGFQPNYDSVQFAVIDEEPKIIREEPVCNNNLFCEAERGENEQNCRLDCVKAEKTPDESGLKETLIVSLGIIVVGAVAFYSYKKRSSSRKK